MLVSTMRGHAAAAKTTMLLALIPLAMTASDLAKKREFSRKTHATVVAGILQPLPKGFHAMMVEDKYIRNPDEKDGYIIQQPITLSKERMNDLYQKGDLLVEFTKALSEVPLEYKIAHEDGGFTVYVTLNEARLIDQICGMSFYNTRRPKTMDEFTEPAFYQHTQGLMSVIYGIDRDLVVFYEDITTRRHLKTILLSSPLEKQNYYLSKEQKKNSKQKISMFPGEKDEDWAKNRGYPTNVHYPVPPRSTLVSYDQYLDEVLQEVPQAVEVAQRKLKAHRELGRLILAQPEQYKKPTKRKSHGSRKADETHYSADYNGNGQMPVDPCADCIIL